MSMTTLGVVLKTLTNSVSLNLLLLLLYIESLYKA